MINDEKFSRKEVLFHIKLQTFKICSENACIKIINLTELD